MVNEYFALNGGGVYSVEHGQVLDSHAMRFAEILHDYNPNFELQFIPANASDAINKPYRVVDNTPGFPRSVVRYMTHQEMHQPTKILADIWKGDLRHHSPDAIVDEIELEEKAKKLMELKAREEQARENEELLAFHMSGGRDGKHYLKYNGQTIAR